MALNDTLANALSKLSQYEQLGKKECVITQPSRIITGVLDLLKQFGYIKSYTRVEEGNKSTLTVELHGRINGAGVVKPRFAVKTPDFTKWEKRYLPSKDVGILVVSTVEGMLSHDKAKEKGIGGRLIAYCY